ncbi:MAG: proton-conducting transporter membrane subunit, partial [Pseudohongiella sp.]
LLHAGVINLGGFLLILFAPLFSLSVAAQTLVIVVAGLSMLIAGLVMMTRISIKVRLAWSTTAQMALMLVECALGLYELALVHMLAHSCYKAFAFLSAGDDVADYLRAQRREQVAPELPAWLVAACIIVPGVAVSALLNGSTAFPLAPWLVVSAALMILIAQFVAVGGWQQILRAACLSLLLLVCYLLLKGTMTSVIPAHGHVYSALFDFWVISLFAVQVLVYLQLQYRPASLPSHRLFIALNAGFYLDEWMTRLTLKWWPISLPRDNKANPAVQPGEMLHE